MKDLRSWEPPYPPQWLWFLSSAALCRAHYLSFGRLRVFHGPLRVATEVNSGRLFQKTLPRGEAKCPCCVLFASPRAALRNVFVYTARKNLGFASLPSPVLPALTGCSARFDVAIINVPVESNVGQKHQLSYLDILIYQYGLYNE